MGLGLWPEVLLESQHSSILTILGHYKWDFSECKVEYNKLEHKAEYQAEYRAEHKAEHKVGYKVEIR
jgi:hypothetical protein